MRAIFVFMSFVSFGCDDIDTREYDGGDTDTESETESESESVSESVACDDGEIVGDLCWLTSGSPCSTIDDAVTYCEGIGAGVPSIGLWLSVFDDCEQDSAVKWSCDECETDLCLDSPERVWATDEATQWIVYPETGTALAANYYGPANVVCVRPL